jgi:UPF0755 protein
LSPSSRTRILFTGIGFSVLIALGFFWLGGSSEREKAVHFQLRRGLSGRQIAKDLHDHGIIGHPARFWLWTKVLGAKRIKPGVYDIPSNSSGLTIYRQFVKGPPLVSVTLPEGLTAKEMGARLEASGICTAKDFVSAVEKENLEGYLFPDTYLFDQETSAPRVVSRLRARFNEMVPQDFSERARALKLTERQLVTLASLVEKEARAAHERPIIAGVFLNRLKKKMLLESCATVQYALGSWKSRLLYKDLKVNSPYNTYLHYGLPPGPICNPGRAALDAAAHPDPTDMLFFVADGQGTHRFTRYYRDHLNAKKKRP